MPGMTPDEIALLLTFQFAIAFLGFVIAAGFRLQLSETHMQISSDPDANDDWPDLYSPMPELPSPRQRWTVRRKAAVVEGVRGGWMPIEEACRLFTTSRSMSSWLGSATSTAMASPVCGAPVIKSIATPTLGGADMSEEPRTEVLRRRIELYLHCVGEGISTAELSDFVQQITEAEDELLMLTTESTFRYDAAAYRIQ